MNLAPIDVKLLLDPFALFKFKNKNLSFGMNIHRHKVAKKDMRSVR
jgi:hypothetical protein